MNNCPECDAEMEYQSGHAATLETPEEIAGFECMECGYFIAESAGEREIARAEWLEER